MSYTPTNWQTGDTITAEKLNKMESGIENANEPFIITFTPTWHDYSGTMDKTVGEINAAYEAGKKIRFHLITGEDEFYDIDVTRIYTDANGYRYFHAELIFIDNNLLIDGFTGGSDPNSTNYQTRVYTLTPMS